ncbi:MAG: hypothetical protein IH881_12650 [Myxococcales bacterium]|nr:hypothetical protein [Myxococcales bacterium]
MATDFDSAGVYFLSVEEFEGWPENDNPDNSAGKKSRAAEGRRGSNTAGEQREMPVDTASISRRQGWFSHFKF